MRSASVCWLHVFPLPGQLCWLPNIGAEQPYVVMPTFSVSQSVFEKVITPSHPMLSCSPPCVVSHEGTCPVVPASPTGETFAVEFGHGHWSTKVTLAPSGTAA